MKNIYETPELEISLFQQSDVMTASDNFIKEPWGGALINIDEVVG